MLVTYFVNFRKRNDHLFGKELFIRFTARAFRKLRSIYVFSYFPFGFEGRMWDLIVSVPNHCLSFYLQCILVSQNTDHTEICFNDDALIALLPKVVCFVKYVFSSLRYHNFMRSTDQKNVFFPFK